MNIKGGEPVELVQVMRSLGDETRIRILNILRDGHLCVGEIETILGVNQSNVSRHLSRLQKVNLITPEKRAQWVYYQINHSTLRKYPMLRELIEKELDKIDLCVKDINKLREYQRQKLFKKAP